MIKRVLFLILWQVMCITLLLLVVVFARLMWIIFLAQYEKKLGISDMLLWQLPMAIYGISLVVLALILLKKALWPLSVLYRMLRHDVKAVQEIEAKINQISVIWK